MKIVLINNLYKPYQKGGAERITEIMHNELTTLGHEVIIISTCPKTRNITTEEKNVYYLKSSYSNLNKHSYLFRLSWQIINLINVKKYLAINKILKKEQPTLVISHNLMGLGLLTPLAIYNNRAKHIHVLHDIQLLHPAGLMYFGQENILKSPAAKIYQSLSRYFFSLSKNKIIISPSNWLLELHKQQGLFLDCPSFVINNPLSATKIELPVTKEKTFSFIGQLEYHKGVDLFLAMAPLFPDYKFILVGDGSLMASITEQKINNLEILGRQSNESVSNIIAKSAAVIIPSRCYENSPTVIYEAYAVKTPAIAADLGGTTELINKFGGLLFKPNSVENLQQAMIRLLKEGVELKNIIPAPNYSQSILDKIS
jgi:glycosyltransferase involved in cell wall biosynthesis